MAPPPLVQQPDTLRAAADSLAAADTAARAALDSLFVPATTPAGAFIRAAQDALREADSARRAAEAVGPRAHDPTPGGAHGPVAEAWAWLVGAVHDLTGLSVSSVDHLLLTLAVVVGLWAARALVLGVVNRRSKDIRVRYQWRKTTSYVVAGLGALLLFRIWIGAIGAFATFLGLLSAGLAIALKDPLTNLAGWVFIVWKRPFSPGDRIQIRALVGDVIDQRVFQFTLLEVGTETGADQSTGRIVHVPNAWIFLDALVNFTRGFPYVWNEVAVRITFESDWRAAKRALEAIAEEHANPLSADAERTLRRAAQEYMIFYSKLTPTVYTDVMEWGIRLTVRYLVEPRRVRGSEQALWEAILDVLLAHEGVEFAYPTSRVFRNSEEGKPGARPAYLTPPPEHRDDGVVLRPAPK